MPECQATSVAPSATPSVAPSASPIQRITPTPTKRFLTHPTKRLLRSQSLPIYTDGRAIQGPLVGAPGPLGVEGGGEVMGDTGSVLSGGMFSDMMPPPSEANNTREASRIRKPVMRDTRATIMQHYYPEGGWGWVVLGMATTVHLLTHGLHTAYGALLGITVAKFSQQSTLVGKSLLLPPI